jgi:hypothetical protein
MNHQPFEDWLLEDQRLTSDQERDLQAHLRICTSCPAIAESNLALHSTRMIRPAEGFAARFQVRLIENRKAARSRQFIGTLILILAGLAFLYWLAGPVIQEAMRSPAQWITTAVGYLVFMLTSIQALSEVSRVFLHILPDFVSPVGWFVIFLLVSGLGALEALSIRRFTRKPQGA